MLGTSGYVEAWRALLIHNRYVQSASNPADGPSRARYPPESLLLPPVVLPPELEPFLCDALADRSPPPPHAILKRDELAVTERARRVEFNLSFEREGNEWITDERYWWPDDVQDC